jgi:hypothetical protein
MSLLNQSHSASPAPASGHAAAAAPLTRPKLADPTRFTIGGQTPEEIRREVEQQRQAAQQQQLGTPADVTDAYHAQLSALKAHQAHVENVRGNQDLTDQGRMNALAAFASTPAAQAVDVAHNAMQQRAAEAKANVDAVRNSLTQPGDAAQEARNSRAWDRAKRVLDNADDGKVGLVARQLISSADRPTLGVLHEELPSYLESRGVEADWLPTAFEQAVPELSAAQSDANQAQRHADVIAYNTTALKRGFETGTPPAKLVDPSEAAA